MATIRRLCALVILTGILTLPFSAKATNGYWSLGYGTKSRSVANACVAMVLDGSCAATNPATLVHLGNTIEVGISIFSPPRGFTANDDASPTMPPTHITPGEYESENDYFPIPNFAYNRMLDNTASLGILVGANGGMNTEYNERVFANFADPRFPETMPTSPTGLDLMQLFVGVAYAKKLNAQHTIGIMPMVSIQAISAEGLQPFTPFSLHPDQVTNNGRDVSYGAGLRLGWYWQVNEPLSIGASYQTKNWMTKLDKYQGLLADEGNFDIPSNFNIGFAYKVIPKLTFSFDYQRINFSDIKALGNSADLVFMPGSTLLGTSNGLGFGWKDINVYKLGFRWQYRPDLLFLAGFAKGSEAFPSGQSLFNVLAPATVQEHYTVGVSKKIGKNQEFDFGFAYVPKKIVHGTNPNTGPQTGSLQMRQWQISLGWNWYF